MHEAGFSVGADEKSAQLYVTSEEAWENLANAVVLQAVEDYREACRTLRRRPRNRYAAHKKEETECFFRCDDFHAFTTIPGGVILEMLEKEQEEINERKRISRTVQAEDGTDRGSGKQNRGDAGSCREVHLCAEPDTGRQRS